MTENTDFFTKNSFFGTFELEQRYNSKPRLPDGGFQDEVFENVKFLGDNWPSQKNTEKAEFIAIFD